MRYFVAAGTRHYREDAELALAHEDVRRAAELFTSMGYQRILTAVSYDPGSGDFENALADWCRTPGLTTDDIVVVYYAGHGDRSPSGQYRLACADSERGRPRSWLSLPNLAEILATSPVRNVLFIVDACHAAAATAEIGTITDAIVAGRGRSDVFGAGTWLLASARHRDLAVDGAFVAELSSAYARGDGPSQRYLAPSVLAERVNHSFTAAGLAQRAACSSVDQSERPPFFENPSFDPRAEITGDSRVHGDVSDLSSHFEPRGRGVEHVHDAGSYFTGRERALQETRAHLAGEGRGHLLVVTGDPGSGKSAVLGRLASDGCADASVNGHHQTLEALVGRLAAAADVKAATPMALFAALADRERPFRVVVDSLDEAGPGGGKAEARRIAWELLRPLAAVACVRLVVGSRRELLPHLGDRIPVVDLDDSVYTEDTDTAEYVAKILRDTGAPYEHCPGIARQVAHEVARRAGRCFLVARMSASALLRGPVVNTSVPGWAEHLPSDVGGAFEAYLQRMPSERHATTMALLTALAFGEGNGLPRKMWVRVAARLAGIALAEADADVLLEEDGSYLARARVDGTTYFRLYHQELTDHVQSRALKHRDLADIQECFVETLSDSVPERDWARAPSYVRAHLATHAAGAGTLDDLMDDASFVVHAEPATLLPAVRQALRRPSLSMAVERYAYLLVDGDPADVDRAALLAFVAHTYGEREFAERAERVSGSLERMCVDPREITPHRVVGRHEGEAYAVHSRNPHWLIEDTVLPDGGRAVLAAPPWTAQVHVWLLEDPSQSTILPHPSHVVGLTLLTDRTGRAEAVTLDAEGALRIWNVADQTLLRTLPGTGYTCLFDSGVLSDGTRLLLCGNDEQVTALSLPSLRPLVRVDCVSRRRHRWNDGPGASACLARGSDALVQVLLCDGVRGRVTLHPLERRADAHLVLDGLAEPLLADHINGPHGTVAAICEPRTGLTLLDLGSARTSTTPFTSSFGWGMGFAHGSGADPVFVAWDDGLVVAGLDAASLRVPTDHEAVTDMSLAAPVLHDERVHLVAAPFTSYAMVLDCSTDHAIGSPLFGHEGALCAIHLLAPSGAGGPDVLAVGNDGTARLWRWGVHQEQPTPSDRDPDVITPEITELLPWSADPGAVMTAARRHIRRSAPGFLDAASHGTDCRLVHELSPDELLDGGTQVQDADGTLNLLSWVHTGRAEHDFFVDLDGWPRTVHESYCVWNRLTTGTGFTSTALPWLHGTPDRAHAHLLPPTEARPHARLLAVDARQGRIRLLNSPEDTPDWVNLAWGTPAGEQNVVSAGFTTPSGDTVLLTATTSRSREGDADGTSPGTRASAHPPTARPAAVGRLWDAVTGTRHRLDSVELAPDPLRLLPHHGSAGTRWLAQRGGDGHVSVVDLVTHTRHPVSPPWPAHKKQVPLSPFLDIGAQWAELPGGVPVLLTSARDALGAVQAPVVVWNSTAPNRPRRLPVRSSGVLATGSAPGGDLVVVVDDGDGIALCHLPSCEKAWSAPLPARVTALAVLPGSEHLDLAVGTQQGVVFLRPRLSPAWRDRLGVG